MVHSSRKATARRGRRWLRGTALALAVLVLAAGVTTWVLYERLNGNITTDTRTAEELRRYERERPSALVAGAQNILIIGSDNRGGGNGAYGADSGTQRSDTTILLHLAADRRSATAVSMPRDLMAQIPRCRRPDGSFTNERFAQFNWAFQFAGAACTIRTVENITHIRIDHHIIVDFSGFKRLVDAVDGVEVCLRRPVDDREARLRLPAGRQILHGEQALGFVRARYGIGDGSDTERMGRQQEFLGALFQEMHSDGVLLNPTRLYPVLDAATKSLTTDAGLGSLRKMYDLVRTVRTIPTERVQFLTVPRRPYPYNAERDELVQPDADRLFELLRHDRPVSLTARIRPADGKAGPDDPYELYEPYEPDSAETPLAPDTSYASPAPYTSTTPAPSAPPSPTAPPTYEGTTAARGICG
ncbi:LCP family protein [Streptomyces caatingaensis]|uniref:LytR family transcriptional regulator n=1 Tax=Streptomyces caatingaensis TaxID=1678637 RepID=A0A0K9XM57_9ACTN|nr:LCP family protein [Streptomyces caatingaensis]KNB54333.1 LytR family transcriptional regulator [Streptomyces caatingaensis]